MIKKYHIGYLMLALAMFSLQNEAFAQKKKGAEALRRAAGITVDGDLSDWDTALSEIYETQTMRYELRSDGQHLFVAVRVQDRNRQVQAISQGLRFTLNTQGKKKEGQTIIFPMADRISLRELLTADQRDRQEDLRQGALQTVRGIHIMRFEGLIDGAISLDNQFGFRAMARIDQEDMLCVEICFPISVISGGLIPGQEMAYNIRINSNLLPAQGPAARPAGPDMQRGGRYAGGRYPGGGYAPARPREEAGIWRKFILETK